MYKATETRVLNTYTYVLYMHTHSLESALPVLVLWRLLTHHPHQLLHDIWLDKATRGGGWGLCQSELNGSVGGTEKDELHLQVDQLPVLCLALLKDIILVQYLCQCCPLHRYVGGRWSHNKCLIIVCPTHVCMHAVTVGQMQFKH